MTTVLRMQTGTESLLRKKSQRTTPSDSEKANEPDPAGVPDKLSEDTQSDPEFTIAPEPPGLETTLSELDSE